MRKCYLGGQRRPGVDVSLPLQDLSQGSRRGVCDVLVRRGEKTLVGPAHGVRLPATVPQPISGVRSAPPVARRFPRAMMRACLSRPVDTMMARAPNRISLSHTRPPGMTLPVTFLVTMTTRRGLPTRRCRIKSSLPPRKALSGVAVSAGPSSSRWWSRSRLCTTVIARVAGEHAPRRIQPTVLPLWKGCGSPKAKNTSRPTKCRTQNILPTRFAIPVARVCHGSTQDVRSPVTPLGALDDDPGAKAVDNIFVAHKAGWYEITDDLPAYDEGPPA